MSIVDKALNALANLKFNYRVIREISYYTHLLKDSD